MFYIKSRLNEVLEDAGMTKIELARELGLRPSTISEIANDSRTTINKKHVIRIMEYLGIKELDRMYEVKRSPYPH